MLNNGVTSHYLTKLRETASKLYSHLVIHFHKYTFKYLKCGKIDKMITLKNYICYKNVFGFVRMSGT